MNNVTHPPTPWKATTGLNVYAMVPAANKDHAVYGVTESKQIALFYDAHDMLFALKACNSHAALLEALEALTEECASGNLVFRGYIDRATLEAAQAALKLAKGEA